MRGTDTHVAEYGYSLRWLDRHSYFLHIRSGHVHTQEDRDVESTAAPIGVHQQFDFVAMLDGDPNPPEGMCACGVRPLGADGVKT